MTFKRILSLVTAVTIFAAGYQPLAIAKDTVSENTREVELMIGLGLMGVDENGDFHSDSPFTRAEMAELIVNTMEYADRYDTLGGGGSFSEKYDAWKFFEGATDYTSYIGEKLAKWEANNASSGETDTGNMSAAEKMENLNIKIYDDVEVNNAAYETINKVTYYGIMNGYDDGKFRPAEYLSSTEAAAVIINLLGYRGTIASMGGYPHGYITIANRVNLKMTNSEEPITRGNLAKLFADALDINLMKLESIGANAIYSDKSDATILSDFMKLSKVEGRVVQNGQTSLTGRSTLSGDGLQVGEKELFVNDKTDYAQKLIGRNVECYYFNSETDRENEVVFAGRRYNREITLNIDDFISYKNNEIKYEYNGRSKSLNLDKNPLYIYNGLAVTNCPESYFDGAQGYITLVSGDNSSTYDLVIIENYRSWFLKRAYENDDKFTVVNALSNSDILEFDVDDIGDKVKIFTSDGSKADISDIKADSVIDVMKNGDIVEIIVSNNVIYDYNVSCIDNQDGLFISNKTNEYEVSKNYTESSSYNKLQAGKAYDIYINSFGKVAYISDVGEDGMKIGYLKKFILDTEGLDDTVYARLIVGDKKSAAYELDEKITFSNNNGTINDKRIKSAKEFYTYLDGVENQAIRYSLNADNKITAVELALDKGIKSTSENRLYVMAESVGDDSDYTYYYADGILGRKVFMEKDTPILVVPSDTQDTSKFRIVDYNSLSKGSRKMTAYGTNQDSPLAAYVLYFDEASATYTEGYEYVVCDVYKMLNEDDEIVTALDVSRRGVNSTLYIAKESDFANGILPISLAVKTTSLGIEQEDYIQPSEGDIISCTTDTANNIMSAALIFDADGRYDANRYKERYEGSSSYNSDDFADFDYDFAWSENGILAGTIGYWYQYVSNTNPFSTDYRNGPVYVGRNNAYGWHMGARRFLLGYVYSVTDNYVTVTTKNLRELGEPMPEGTFGEEFLSETYEINRYWNYVDMDGRNVISGLVSDNPECIKPYKEYGSACSRVLICSGSTAVNEVYIINGNR